MIGVMMCILIVGMYDFEIEDNFCLEFVIVFNIVFVWDKIFFLVEIKWWLILIVFLLFWFCGLWLKWICIIFNLVLIVVFLILIKYLDMLIVCFLWMIDKFSSVFNLLNFWRVKEFFFCDWFCDFLLFDSLNILYGNFEFIFFE